MTAVTQVFTDKTEYSKYHADLAVVTATVIVSSPTAGATLDVALVRLDGYGAVSKKTITLIDAVTQYTVTFNLTRDTLDAKGIYRAKQGDYAIQISDSAETLLGESPLFAVSIVPIAEIKNTWATGVTFMNYETLLPKVQPQKVTGVKVYEIPLDHYKGPFSLKYTASSKSLSWDHGPLVPITGSHPQQILLLDKRQQDYIMVKVDPLSLPNADQEETLVIDNSRLSERDMIDQVRRATDWVQQRIITKVEPETVDTDNGDYADDVAIPQTYYKPTSFGKFMSFNLPYPNILDIEQITGWMNTAQATVVPRQWYVWNEKTGIVELVPATSAQISWQFYNGLFAMQYLQNYPSIPSFWHYRITCGLRDLNNERGVVREAIAKKAVFEMLNSAGSAYRAGYASQSTSRDGISESEGYTSSATFGTYGGHFTSYKEWLEKEIPRMKKRFNGIIFTSI
jgi:hypothetical protein